MTIVERISHLENGMEPVEYFKPSKTAQNALNFLSQKHIDELKSSEKEEIVNIFKCLNIICSIPGDTILSFFDNSDEPLSKLYLSRIINTKHNNTKS